MEAMATVDTILPVAPSTPAVFVELSPGPVEPISSIAARRRRMELRRSKMLNCSGALSGHVNNKRSRLVASESLSIEETDVPFSKSPPNCLINDPNIFGRVDMAIDSGIGSMLEPQPFADGQFSDSQVVSGLEAVTKRKADGTRSSKNRFRRHRVVANGDDLSSSSSSSSGSTSSSEGASSRDVEGDEVIDVPQTISSILRQASVVDIDMVQGNTFPAMAPTSSPMDETVSAAAEHVPIVSTCVSGRVDDFAADECPSHGTLSLCGRRREMEDAVAIVPTFTTVPCGSDVGCKAGGGGEGNNCQLHFFAVYDGHGGSQAAIYCAERLHNVLTKELKQSLAQSSTNEKFPMESHWRKAMTSSFLRMDAEISGHCYPPGACEKGSRCQHEPIAPETVGSTSVVAVVGVSQIIVANAGDSRAVLSRGGRAFPLSIDHKPEREDEMRRVEAAGGRVIFWNGYRVLGVLAMSRAIGDRYLKPYVIAVPEVTFTERTEDDECIILASDGLWDVMSNESACDIARRCLAKQHGLSSGGEGSSASVDAEEMEGPGAAVAATVLTKLALARGSGDNISVVVVDLKSKLAAASSSRI